MADKCRKGSGATLVRCDAAQHAISFGFVDLQTLRNHETGKTRQRMALRKGRQSIPLQFCPWCRAAIDTSPATPSAENGGK